MGTITPPDRNVIDFAVYRDGRRLTAIKAQPLTTRICQHCGAVLGEGDSEDECSSAGISVTSTAPRRKFRAE